MQFGDLTINLESNNCKLSVEKVPRKLFLKKVLRNTISKTGRVKMSGVYGQEELLGTTREWGTPGM